MLIIDRFENEFAVCEKEDGTFVNIKRADLPLDALEGDVLDLSDDGKYVICRKKTKERKDKIEKKFFNLFVD